MEITRNLFLCLVGIVTTFLLPMPSLASKRSYIVYLGGHSHGREATNEDFKLATNSHYDLLEPFLGSKKRAREAVFYSYTKHINGFAAILEEEEALKISKHPRVISLFENKALKLHTTRSWSLLGLEKNGKVLASSVWVKAKFGKDTIIGHLDTGVWPESKSFDDKGMGPVPSRWKGYCDNNTRSGVRCSRKLIGARYFNKGFMATTDGNQPTGDSARDLDGHGTHTLSTAAGNRVPGASIFGYAKGTASGGSPYARAAMYKVCWDGGCYGADILAGYDAAIHDGVDVISVSLGGYAVDYITDPTALGAFHAVSLGISVVCSASNSGPYEGSVLNTAPWITTVGATTLDREFPSYLVLGNKMKIKGQSLSQQKLAANKLYPLIKAEDGKASHATPDEANLCYSGSLDPRTVEGKIVVCLRGDNDKMEKGGEVIRARGIGMILVNDEYSGNTASADLQILPETNIGFKDSLSLYCYMNSTKSPVGTISAPITKLGVKPAPVIADFSSRGPSLITPQILKPDITAPGDNILAAFSEATSPTSWENDTRHVEFNLLSGTSMSCPHVSGLTGLLKTMYPDWSPAAIRSAIMTTAKVRDNTGSAMKDYDKTKATPFAYGSGQIWPNRAMNPGLIYDLTVNDYLNFLCALGYNATAMAEFSKRPYKCPTMPIKLEDLNYPSIAVPGLNGSITVTRTLKNVGSPGMYKVRVADPVGVTVSVRPGILNFRKVGELKKYEVSFKSGKGSVGAGYAFGVIIWSDGKHHVRTPLAVNAIS